MIWDPTFVPNTQISVHMYLRLHQQSRSKAVSLFWFVHSFYCCSLIPIYTTADPLPENWNVFVSCMLCVFSSGLCERLREATLLRIEHIKGFERRDRESDEGDRGTSRNPMSGASLCAIFSSLNVCVALSICRFVVLSSSSPPIQLWWNVTRLHIHYFRLLPLFS